MSELLEPKVETARNSNPFPESKVYADEQGPYVVEGFNHCMHYVYLNTYQLKNYLQQCDGVDKNEIVDRVIESLSYQLELAKKAKNALENTADRKRF